jgi:hypothetical protein
MRKATAAGAAMPAAMAAGKGQPWLIVRTDEVYAPIPMNAALAIASMPHDSVR